MTKVPDLTHQRINLQRIAEREQLAQTESQFQQELGESREREIANLLRREEQSWIYEAACNGTNHYSVLD